MSWAMTSVDPLIGNVLAAGGNVIVDPTGASRGTFLHPAASATPAPREARVAERNERDTMRTITILIAMDLAGQAKKKPERQHSVAQDGYAMAALIVGMGIMALMMTVVMPVWKQAARREKEE